MDLTEALRDLISRVEKRRLGNRVLWDVISALRGPDANVQYPNDLKRFTVARLRGIIGMHFEMIDRRCDPLTPFEIHRRDELLESHESAHFKLHWEKAIEAVRSVYDYDLDTEQPIEPSLEEPKPAPKKKSVAKKKRRR